MVTKKDVRCEVKLKPSVESRIMRWGRKKFYDGVPRWKVLEEVCNRFDVKNEK